MSLETITRCSICHIQMGILKDREDRKYCDGTEFRVLSGPYKDGIVCRSHLYKHNGKLMYECALDYDEKEEYWHEVEEIK